MKLLLFLIANSGFYLTNAQSTESRTQLADPDCGSFDVDCWQGKLEPDAEESSQKSDTIYQ